MAEGCRNRIIHSRELIPIDRMSPQAPSRVMSTIRKSATGPEAALLRALRAAGFPLFSSNTVKARAAGRKAVQFGSVSS